jgi:hypothetical protein
MSSLHCSLGYQCLATDDGGSICLPGDCAFMVLEPPLCGTPDAKCGDERPVCTPQCEARECGPDPVCGKSCGECDPATSYCNLSGECAPNANFCEGSLSLMGSPVDPVDFDGEPPDASGGSLTDATFDLIEMRVYGSPTTPPEARREALRFFDSGMQAEQVLEVLGDVYQRRAE